MNKRISRKTIITSIIIVVALLSTVCLSNLFVNAAPTYNYGEALQKSIMFYEFQRAGKLPTDKRDNWRGDSALNDGSDVGKDLTGGWFDAGDHVKFNLPMSYTAAMLAWSVYEDKDAYEKSGQLDYMMDAIKWANDYFIKCHTATNEYYYQVGDGGKDHSWWGPAEVMQMERPSFKVTSSSPGSTVVAGTAASLALAAIIFKDTNSSYASTCLSHAKQLYTFAETTKSDAGYTAASGYYQSWSGWNDELSWAGVWLYRATGDETYLDKAESYVANWGTEGQTEYLPYKWSHCWDDVHYGAQLLLAQETDKALYKESVERSLDFWTTGFNGEKIAYSPKGLACLDVWGSLRYATTMAYLADVWAESGLCTSSKTTTYKNFAKSQTDMALGAGGRSYVIGFGTNPPKRPHHRTAHGSWADSQTVPTYHRHSLIGALVGGPNSSDSYTDDISNYQTNEVACDYNAGFTGILARLYKEHGGTPVANLKAIEEVTEDEFFVEAGINSSGPNYIEIKALLNNRSGWPARMGDKLSYRYYFDISEFISNGYSINDLKITTNYNQAGAKITGPTLHSGNIYYVTIDCTGAKIYPGGQSQYKSELQFRLAGPNDTKFWDSSNDYSFKDLSASGSNTLVKTKNIPVYDNGKLVFGVVPGGSTTTTVVPTTTTTRTTSTTTTTTTTPPVTTSQPPVTTSTSPSPSVTTSVPTTVPTTSQPTVTPSTGSSAVTYKAINDWGAGATCEVTIKASTAMTSWKVTWTYAGNQKITNLWSGKYTQSGAAVTVTNEAWNGNIPANGSVTFGFNISYSGSNAAPTDIKLN